MPKKTKKKVKNKQKQKIPNNSADNNDHDRDDASDSDIDVSHIKVEELEVPIKSEKDLNEYRVVKLPNGIVAVLVAEPIGASAHGSNGDALKEAAEAWVNVISNNADERHKCTCHTLEWLEKTTEALTNTSKAYIYLTVGAGCFSDPRHVPGICNFVSEIVLGNSKKYPHEEDKFDNFLGHCGGDELRYAHAETTTFGIGVPDNHFVEIMDRLAHCFISPVMDREDINVLKYNFQATFVTLLKSGLLLGVNEKENLFMKLASAGHPVKTLGPYNFHGLVGVPDDQFYRYVIKFRERNYSAHRMTLVLKASLPLETLEMYAKKYFSKIPNNHLPPRDLSQYNFANTFVTPKSRKMYRTQSTNSRDSYVLELSWTLPPSHWLYRSKPRDYLASLLQHEGEGSLVSYLRKKNWCNKIVIGNNDTDLTENSIYCLFSLEIHLSQEGHNNHKKILDAVFSYINLLRRTGPQERIFNELRKIEDAKFRFERNFEDVQYYGNLCRNMHLYPPIDYLTGRTLYLEYDYVSLKTCTDLLAPDRATIVVYDKDFNKGETIMSKLFEAHGDRLFRSEVTSSCFGGDQECKPNSLFYTSTDIPDEWINHWKNVEAMPNFDLPKPNVFLPDDFTLIPAIKDPPKYPVKIYSDPLSEVWYKPDSRFRMPQCFMYFRYVTPLAMADPENAAMLDLFVEALKRVMLEELYPAFVAGLKYEVKACGKGLEVEAHGFNEKLPILMRKISKYIAKCPKLVTEDLFKRIKLEQEEKYGKSLLDPDQLCEELRLSIVRFVHWTTLDKQTALVGIKFHNFQHFLERFGDHVYLQCLVQGNISKAVVIENTKECVKLSNHKPLSPNTMPRVRVHEIPRGQRCCRVKSFDPESQFCKVKNYYQIGDTTSHRLSVVIDLLVMIMSGPKFKEWKDIKIIDEVCVAKKHTCGMFGYSIMPISKMNEIPKHLLEDTNTLMSEPEGIVYIEEKIENYRKNLNVWVKSLPGHILLCIKTLLLTVKKRPDSSLRSEISRNWHEITSGDCVFNRREQEIAAINALSIEDMRKWLAHLTTDASKLRTLSVQVCSNKEIKRLSTDRNVTHDRRDFEPDRKNNYQCGLTYLTDLPKRKDERGNYYITDIAEFKTELKVLPILKKVTASTKATNSPS